MSRLEGKVALITGAARGQGRSHAVTLAEQGADIILFDICHDIDTNNYPLATPHDLEEARLEVEKTGRRAVAAEVDVRDRTAVRSNLDHAVGELGGLDVVVANAGICALGDETTVGAFCDTFDVNFVGMINAVHSAIPHLKAGASIITIGSIAALVSDRVAGAMGGGPGGDGYNVSKSFINQYTVKLAKQLAPRSIRANVIHPTNVKTDMLLQPAMYKMFRPDLENPTLDDAMVGFPMQQSMPIPYIETADVSSMVAYLASDESRYVTGSQFTVDGGAMLRFV
ncbi:Putative short-chain type dehydrogenase/reductase/MSMEI_5872 [Mycolicibacterium vanbaalenii]|uniref:Short-chain type dehydrogenase/reductase/MSMEI_5872 n=1 Tax=Mycolicibacterium vanbaalenii TaxID=110539 RepID=A0A5S9RB48_MYCVN|nr:mycofactocin-coupled SDR family oxidoreductase [Mycolicibacterium vanbaalenii]CAA0137680.1 Putative short-chain type dehydrogenase/reductase/MSMEI_5872 [Mycolicibacterium vanbaalenii]